MGYEDQYKLDEGQAGKETSVINMLHWQSGFLNSCVSFLTWVAGVCGGVRSEDELGTGNNKDQLGLS